MELKKEIMPVGSRILIRLMKENPYLTATTEEGLVLTNGKFENPDSGDVDLKDFPVKCAEVIECGMECKYTKPGDHVLVNINSLMPVPFKGDVWFCLGEVNVVAVLADDIKERLNKD